MDAAEQVSEPTMTRRQVVRVPPPHDPRPANSKKLREAKAAMLMVSPFAAQLLFTMLPIHWSTFIPTAATDGNKVYLNKEDFEGQSINLMVSTLVHETLHCMFMHLDRGQSHETNGLWGKPFSHELYNVAADFIINALIKDMGMQVGDDWLLASDVKGTELTEEIYRRCLDAMKDAPQPPGGTGQGGSSGNAGGEPSSPGEDPTEGNYPSRAPRGRLQDQIKDAVKAGHDRHIYSPADRSHVEWRQAVESARTAVKAMGKMPGSLEEAITNYNEPKIPWKEKLRTQMMRNVAMIEKTWNRFNRRYLAEYDIYLPGRTGFGAGFIPNMVDTSGSVSPDETKAFISEIASILEEVRPERCCVIWCDARVAGVDWVEEPSDLLRLTAKGGGGTDFRPPFNWLVEENLVPDVAVYLTDGHGTFPEDPGYPVIWVCTTDVVAPFGETIHLDIDE